MSVVHFYPLNEVHVEEDILAGIERLYEAAGFGKIFSKNDFCAVKLHFGEKGNLNYLSPVYVKKTVSLLRKNGVKPFLTDANTIYQGSRANSVDHLTVAYRHGFLPEKTGAPVIIADGLTGKDYRLLTIDKKHFRTVKIGSAALDCDSMMVLTHFKGHMLAGYGGALKNVGMGLASRSGKQEQHSDVKPKVIPTLCTLCLACMGICPANAIREGSGSAHINHDKCIGCGECTAVCMSGAIKVRWATDNRTFQEKMIEYAYGILDRLSGRAAFINFLINITPHCDCMETDDPPIAPDIGILASRDPVSLDRACADLVNSREGLPSSNFGKRVNAISAGQDKFREIHNIDWSHQLKYAEKLGLGELDYDLVELR